MSPRRKPPGAIGNEPNVLETPGVPAPRTVRAKRGTAAPRRRAAAAPPRTITISPVTRIEGHAKITLFVDDAGQIDRATFHITEFRGFEKIAEGRPFQEMPGLMARICGICPMSHMTASAKAGDQLLGVQPPPAAVRLRRLANHAQVLQSHALSFFHLSSPDLLMGFDCDPAQRNLFGMLESDRGFVRRGIRLRQFGQTVLERLGGRRIHSPWMIPGGVRDPITPEARDELRGWMPEVFETIELAMGRFKGLLELYREEVENLGAFPSLFLGLVDDEGHLDFYDGHIRIMDGEGNMVADRLEPERFTTYIGEASEDWTYVKTPYYKPLGYPGGMYRVGPLARLNVIVRTGTTRADAELREFRERGPECRSFGYHHARLIEMLHAAERIEELLDDPGLCEARVTARALPNWREGVGVCEAPRGTLFHQYSIDEDGLMLKANLLVATAQNNLAMNRAVEQTAKHFVKPNALTEGMLNRVEAAIRCYDPCLSCSTHALGRMPLLLEVRTRSGELVNQIERGR